MKDSTPSWKLIIIVLAIEQADSVVTIPDIIMLARDLCKLLVTFIVKTTQLDSSKYYKGQIAHQG